MCPFMGASAATIPDHTDVATEPLTQCAADMYLDGFATPCRLYFLMLVKTLMLAALLQAETVVKAVQRVQQTQQQVHHTLYMSLPKLCYRPSLTVGLGCCDLIAACNRPSLSRRLLTCVHVCLDSIAWHSVSACCAGLGLHWPTCLQASATSPSTQSRFAPKAVPGQFQDVSMRAGSAGYGPGFTYSTSQAPHGQMNPLLMDYAGLQYPGY